MRSVTSNTAEAKSESPGSLFSSITMNSQGKLWEMDGTATAEFLHSVLLSISDMQGCFHIYKEVKCSMLLMFFCHAKDIFQIENLTKICFQNQVFFFPLNTEQNSHYFQT